MTDADLDSLMSIGYAAISVAGLEISDERAAGDGGEPREVVELREMIVSQSQSPGVRAVGEILFEEHGILQTVPATSETIARLGVAVVVGEAAEDGARRVSVELELSRGLELWRSEAQATMAPAASAAETLRSFRGAVGACLGEAIAALEPVAVGAPF